MIALLAFVPLRRKNIAAIEIGRHLVQEGDRWFTIIPRGETKTGTSIEFAIPDLLVPYLATYLSIVRPRILQGPSCKALWINRGRRCALPWRSLGSRYPAHGQAARYSHLSP